MNGENGLTYRDAAKKLTECGSDNGRYEAALLLCKLFGLSMSEIPLLSDRDFDSPELTEAIEKRAGGYPLQYILGEWDFYGLTFEVSEHCLCPRADTETAVEAAIKLLPREGIFLELCTGSGCIPVSVCKYRPDLVGVATDLYEETLAIAQRNAERNGVNERVEFVLADVFDLDFWQNGKGKGLIPEGGFDALISNPPYIPTGDIDGLSTEVKHEPRAALDGGDDGLDFYRFITQEYGRYLANDGKIIFEIGYDQGEALSIIAAENGYTCRILKDLGGNDRVAVLEK